MTHKRFFIITIQYTPAYGRLTVSTLNGYSNGIPNGHSEESMFDTILALACESKRASQPDTSVLFYYLGKPEAE
jgi:hypothetical protein